MNTFMNNLKKTNNYTFTENNGVTYKSTLNAVLDMFALGGSYRKRTEDDCITLFENALKENVMLAMKCLFYLRDCRGGQGERRFFRVCYHWLAKKYPHIAKRYIEYLPEFGRWDDLYCLVDTPLENDAFELIKSQLKLDITCKTPSLLAKWLKSENCSNKESKELANKTREFLGLNHKKYRKTLSLLRERINLLERLMSANRWDEIKFDMIPSKAGLIYKNAFARRDLIAKKYEAFAKSKETKVNANVLYPHEVARMAFQDRDKGYDSVDRLMIQKYWDNLPNYYGDNEENGIAVIDVSGSMIGRPMEAAVSMGAYIAEKAHGPFAGHFITFSEHPELVSLQGSDIVHKFQRCVKADWGMNTNIVAVFKMLLNVIEKEDTKPEDIPNRIYIFSDMEFDECVSLSDPSNITCYSCHNNINQINTVMEIIAAEWKAKGYKLPDIIFWNLDARNDNIPALNGRFSYVSGFSPVMIQTILSGKNGIDLMLEKLNSERYAVIK